ncbi:MAG: ComEA family DNA-binding protein [Zhongshania sp.]|uniref:ComEA family DNA-binding protein n=1 Tax=Zhongshania sp. TaxID=1971902 RepID=UPI00260BA2F6|nr:ComEA family DNA-binding protein [Zhongshania sp.]MDF1692095.1 ComEA family DNA-binding protein [Zhongshania sp.]
MKTFLRRWSASLILFCSLLLTMLSAHALDVNTASAEELQALKGIGEKRAAAIIQYRSEHGPFKSTEDLLKVPGIGNSIITANSAELEFANQATN